MLPFAIKAQVTTSSITGYVKNSSGEPLDGATITAVHVPSGTKYVTISKKDGNFTIPNTRIGGPYNITVEFVGYQPAKLEGVTLNLGEPYNADVTLSQKANVLQEVTVAATGRSRIIKTGASTNITSRMINTMPTISRSITDFTRTTPQANGTSFAGRDARYNNVTVDGANLNNNFGLSSDPLPGGGANPIPLDAIEQITVSIAPYDVRQGSFTGANIAAVTKSGTNIFKGSAYTYYRDQSFNGTYVGSSKLPPLQKSYNKIYGATLGGPIIKDKLFFFANYEYEEKSSILNYYTPAGGSGSGNTSNVPISDMKRVADYLKSKYNYDPGQYDNFSTGSPVKNHKILGKLDWNISDVHKLTLKYSELVGSQNFLPSQSGGINGASSSGLVTYGPKFSKIAMAFGNTVYTQNDAVKSGSLELSSNWGGKFSNQLLATYTKISTKKAHLGAQFPFVDILSPTGKNNYISFGNEPFNGNYNVVLNDVYSLTDNFSYYVGKHTLTAGATYEYQKVGNGFMAGSQGYYVFKNVDDFLNDAPPILFSQTYSLIKGQDAVISASLKIGQLGAYVQDEININPRVKITAGLRIDKPIYPEQPLENKAISALPLLDHDGNVTHYTTGEWPRSTIYWSPRVGFRWTPEKEKGLVVRGGTGLFTGRIPFVYLTNIPTGSGMYQFGPLVTNPAILQNMHFNPDPHTYNPFYNTSLDPSIFPTTAGTNVPTGAYALTSKNFKFPQIWRTDLGVDKSFGKGWLGTIELIYSKDVHGVYMFNANQADPNTTVDLGGGEIRPSYTASSARKVNANSGNAIVLDNTNKGESFAATVQLSKSFSKGFYGSIAYTYTGAFDVTASPGSQATSVWSANPTALTQNDLELSYSNFATPHRINANFGYRIEYLNHLATSISIVYSGASQGNFSFIYNGDVNNDGNSADLMYIPKDPSEIKFAPIPASGTPGQAGYVPGFTAQQESDAFFKFIDQDSYLSKHKGQNAKRFGTNMPFYHRVDMKIAQDIFTNIGGRRNTLQITADVLNVLNLISRNWGIQKSYIVANPLKYVSNSGANGAQATFQLATYLPEGQTNQVLLDRTYIDYKSVNTTWGLQLGLRYIF